MKHKKNLEINKIDGEPLNFSLFQLNLALERFLRISILKYIGLDNIKKRMKVLTQEMDDALLNNEIIRIDQRVIKRILADYDEGKFCGAPIKIRSGCGICGRVR